MRTHTLLPVLLTLAVPCALARNDPWTEQFGGTPDLSFSGITTFAHLPHERCLDNPAGPLDIGLIGMPFDNAVSFRPGEMIIQHCLADFRGSVRTLRNSKWIQEAAT